VRKSKEKEEAAIQKPMYRPHQHRVCFDFDYCHTDETEFKPPLTGEKEDEDKFLKQMRNYTTLSCLRTLPVDTSILGIRENLDMAKIEVYLCSRAFPKLAPIGAATMHYSFFDKDALTSFLEALNDYE